MNPGRTSAVETSARSRTIDSVWSRLGSLATEQSSDKRWFEFRELVRSAVRSRIGVMIWTRLWDDCQIRETQKGGET